MAREDDGGGASDAPELDAGFLRVKAQPSRVPSDLAARMTWVWANFVNDPPSGECRNASNRHPRERPDRGGASIHHHPSRDAR